MPLATTIVQTNAIARNSIRQTYSHVFLDEFQDCTKEQYQLIKACFSGSPSKLTAVGDAKQKIMGWAGALEGIFKTFASDFGATPLSLYQNFRSKPRLRRMQNAMVQNMDPAAAVDDAELAGDEGVIRFIRAADAVQEAEAIAATVKRRIVDDGIAPSEIAILVSRDQSFFCQRLRAALQGHAIPFREEDSSQDFAAEPIVKAIVDLLLIAGTSASPDAHRRLIDLMVYSQAADEEHEYRAWSRWSRFVTEIRDTVAGGAIDNGDRAGLRAIIDGMFKVMGTDAIVALSADYAHGSRLHDLVEQTVDRLHDVLAHENDIGVALSAFSGDKAVRVMSIHKCKGLEFDTVIVIGVENETFWGNPVDQRAAYFVAISRAKKQLFLSFVANRERPTGFPANRPWDIVRHPHQEFLGYAIPYQSGTPRP